MTLVVATIALLAGLALPAVHSLVNSFQSEGGARSMISAALSSARATAVNNQRYVGVRFQRLCTSNDPLDPLKGFLDAPQYMVFIMHGERSKMGGLDSGFRAIEGLEPIKLPDTVSIIDVGEVAGDADLDTAIELNDAMAFSIVFSPAGKLMVRDVQMRNTDGIPDPDRTGPAKTSRDPVFNSPVSICTHRVGMFVQDDYPAWRLEKEPSRASFMICNRQRLQEAFKRTDVWSGLLSRLPKDATVYVSPYTGNLISSE